MISSTHLKLPEPIQSYGAHTLRAAILQMSMADALLFLIFLSIYGVEFLGNRMGAFPNRFEICPDWSIEILSPDQSQTKVTRNILHCLECGTAMGWLIDAEESCVLVYQPNQTPKLFDQPHTLLPTPSFAPDIELTIEQMFGWLIIE